MLYRNRTFQGRFDKSTQDYDSNDRKQMLQYMREKGFATPKAVWLANIRAFLQIRLESDMDRWSSELKDVDYPMDAEWFIKHLTQTFLSFCTTASPEDEFLLTQNAYSIFEGPSSSAGWMDWHVFPPINPKLIIVMRSKWLNQLSAEFGDIGQHIRRVQESIVDKITSVFEEPRNARSWLEDIPLSRPQTSYPTIRIVSRSGRLASSTFSDEDIFTFKFFSLSTSHMQRLNTLFLEEALGTQAIVYKSETGLRRALEEYLAIEKSGFKNVMVEAGDAGQSVSLYLDGGGLTIGRPREFRREAYLKLLEKVTRQLGSNVKARYTIRLPRSLEIVPPMPLSFWERYRKFGEPFAFGQFCKVILSDWNRMLVHWDRYHCERLFSSKPHHHPEDPERRSSQKGNSTLKAQMQKQRRQLVDGLQPRRVWLHLRQSRVMAQLGEAYNSSREDLMRCMVADDVGGPEDALIDAFEIFRYADFTRIMTRLFIIDSFSKSEVGPGTVCRRSRISEEDFDMSHYLILYFPGTVLRCGIPKLEEAARNICRAGCSQQAFQRTLASTRQAYKLPKDDILELCIRNELDMRIKEFLADDLEPAILQRLRDVLFGSLFRLEIP